jgi:hypothetical protein
MRPATCILSSTIALMTIIPTAAADCSIDFENLPHGTAVSQQYQGCGVVFDSLPGQPLPMIYDASPAPEGKILHSWDWYAPVIVSFVNPANPSEYRPVSYIQFGNPAGDMDVLYVRVFTTNGSLIGTYTSPFGSPETVALDFGDPIAAFMIVDDQGDTAYIMDDLIVLEESPIFMDGFDVGNADRWSNTSN